MEEESGKQTPKKDFVVQSTGRIRRKVTKMSLIDFEEKYRSIVETADEGIWICDMDAITIFVNKKMTEILGCSESQMIGKTPFEFMDEEAKAMADSFYKRIANGYKDKYEQKYIRKDGSIVCTCILVSDHGQTPPCGSQSRHDNRCFFSQDGRREHKAE